MCKRCGFSGPKGAFTQYWDGDATWYQCVSDLRCERNTTPTTCVLCHTIATGQHFGRLYRGINYVGNACTDDKMCKERQKDMAETPPPLPTPQ